MDASDLPRDPFGRPVQLPATFDRKHRVRLLHEAALAWTAGQQPSDEARVYAANGLLAWLESPTGDLLRDFWKVRGPQGSTATPAVLLREALLEERQTAVLSAKCCDSHLPDETR